MSEEPFVSINSMDALDHCRMVADRQRTEALKLGYSETAAEQMATQVYLMLSMQAVAGNRTHTAWSEPGRACGGRPGCGCSLPCSTPCWLSSRRSSGGTSRRP